MDMPVIEGTINTSVDKLQMVNSIWYKNLDNYPEKVRYKVIGGEMKGMESSMNLVALGATQRKG